MWKGKPVSVILPTYNEKDSIRQAVDDLFATGLVDEVIVVNNNAKAGTDDEVVLTKATLVYETRQGYGFAIRRGLEVASGEYLVVSEPDGTFVAQDVLKLLAYSDDCDVVYGSRTVREFIWSGANMGLFLRWGNYAVAKLMEVLFSSSTLSDVGCTMRLLTRPALLQMQPHFTVGGSFFGPEMMLISLLLGQRIVQIPVNYTKRVGTSSVTGDTMKAFRLGLRMIWLILDHRARSWAGVHPVSATAPPPIRARRE